MDRVIEKKKWSKKRLLTIAGIVAIVLLAGASYYMVSGKNRLNVDVDRITISEVKKTAFQEFIAVNGAVMPQTSIYLDAIEGGRVEEKFVEDGAMVKKDQPLLRLSNTDLELSLINEETSVFNLLTQMRISSNAAQQNTIGKLNQSEDVDNALTEAKRIYDLDKTLYEKKAIGSQEFKQAENGYNYQVAKQKLARQVLSKDSSSTRQEADEARQTLARTQNALEVMKKKVGDLIVRAPVDGQLTSLDAEIGQSKNKGERLGQVDAVNGFKARVTIDEHYLQRIFTGLMGEADVNGKTYRLKVTKVYLQVANNQFQVDMQFTDSIPVGIRRGQTLQIRLSLSEETQAVVVPRGGFFQTTGGAWIFKLSDDGTRARRINVQFNRQSPDYYEVIDGLKPGDKVITSSYENYTNMQELILKK